MSHAFFDDLTPYSHMIEPFFCEDVLNIGWLNLRAEFSTQGVVSVDVRERLLNLAFGKWLAKAVVEPCRVHPVCAVCGPVEIERNGRVLVDSELWIPGASVAYASPLLLLHYIEAHGYVPPAEYLAAVEKLTPETPFDGEVFYRKQLIDCGWFANRADRH